MATILGTTVAAHYGETVLVYSEELIECVVDGAPPGETGRLFRVEPGKPKRVPYEAWRFMRDHLGYTGVVEVDVIETKDDLGNVTGTKYDLEKAKRDSEAKLKVADEQRFQYWLNGVIEDYVKRSKPVPQPDDAIQRLLDRRGYDLKQYGIVPIGWREKQHTSEVEALRAELAELKKQLGEK